MLKIKCHFIGIEEKIPNLIFDLGCTLVHKLFHGTVCIFWSDLNLICVVSGEVCLMFALIDICRARSKYSLYFYIKYLNKGI